MFVVLCDRLFALVVSCVLLCLFGLVKSLSHVALFFCHVPCPLFFLLLYRISLC